MHNLGHTRSTNQRDHLLQTPDTFVRTVLPGMHNAVAIVHISPAAGASFTQYTAELEAGGSLGPTAVQRFIYVLEGTAELKTEGTAKTLTPASFSYLPAYGLLSARLTYTPKQSFWDLSLFATNLADKKYLVSVGDSNGVGVVYQLYGRPREFGATLGLHF